MKNTKLTDKLGSPWVAIIILAFVTLFIYSNIYNAPFVFDDLVQIEDKTKIRDISRFLSIEQLFSPRPLVEFTFALNYKFGKLNVFGYHLVNVFIHMMNAFLVYFIALNIGNLLPYSVKSPISRHSDVSLMALISALIFVTHPIQTQAVTYTVQRYTSMAALFYFLSILFYIKGRCRLQDLNRSAEGVKGQKPGSKANPDKRTKRKKAAEVEGKRKSGQQISTFRFVHAAWFGFAFLFGVLAFLCKQNAASLPGVILLMEYILFDRTWKGWKKKLTWFVPAFLLMGLFILYVSGFFRGGFNFGRLLEDVSVLSRETVEVTRWNYLCTQFNVIAIYIRLLFLPFGQNLDYMYPFKEGFFDGVTPLAFLFLAGIVAIGLWCIRKRPAITLGVFWFFITLSVESSIIPISDAMFEHRLYLPMFGFALVMGYVLFDFLQNKKLWLGIVSVAVIGYFGTAAYLRNRVWQDPVTLWSDVLSKNPVNYRAHNNLGNALKDQGDVREALGHYREALRIKPDFGDVHNNLGNALMRQGKLDEAIAHLQKAVRFEPRYASAYNNLGVALAANGDLKEAHRCFSAALRLKPDFAGAHNSLANTLAKEGEVEKAIKHWHRAIQINAEYAEPHYNLGMTLGRRGAIKEAIAHFSEAIRIKPDYAKAHSKLAILLAQKRDFDGALDHFAQALKIKPGLTEARRGMKEVLTLKNKSGEY
ncbi:MAG: tetratricopeptide repeat protein [Thermodesulfobacteriota bacterium]